MRELTNNRNSSFSIFSNSGFKLRCLYWLHVTHLSDRKYKWCNGKYIYRKGFTISVVYVFWKRFVSSGKNVYINEQITRKIKQIKR